jgi:predicted nucleic acid-binding protein
VLPFDQDAASVAAEIWFASSRRHRQQLGDILIASIAVSRQIPLATRNKRDFQQIIKNSGVELRLLDWASTTRRAARRRPT